MGALSDLMVAANGCDDCHGFVPAAADEAAEMVETEADLRIRITALEAENKRLSSDLEKTCRAFCFIDAATAVDEGKSACDYAESFYPNLDENDCLPGLAFSHAHKYAEELYKKKVWEAVIAALAEKEVGDGPVD